MGAITLGAFSRISDTLSGRKVDLWLTPMTQGDMTDFGNTNMLHRILRGGLPPFYLAEETPERDFQEWMDSYWAKDIQELFRLERRHSFQRFTELLIMQSGGIFEATRFAAPCQVNRSTISNYLAVLESTFVAHIVRPFSSHRPTEIVSAPKVYAFDTGFVCYYRGWYDLRTDDLGLLWEHLVLNELHAALQSRHIGYWRDKRGHEVDFVLANRSASPTALECKWSASAFDPTGVKAFRKQYPEGKNIVVASDIPQHYVREYDGVHVQFVALTELLQQIQASA